MNGAILILGSSPVTWGRMGVHVGSGRRWGSFPSGMRLSPRPADALFENPAPSGEAKSTRPKGR
jgi:hypothetical protein